MQECTNARSERAFLRSCIRAWHDATDSVLSVVLAPECVACGGLLERPTSGPVCAGCWRSLVEAPSPPAVCLGGKVGLAGAIGEYDGALRATIHALKYEGRRSLAWRLSALMRDRGVGVLTGADAVVPVPLHPSRRRSRGFNQAHDLARHLGLPVCDVLTRTRATSTQTDLPAEERRRNVRDAFALRCRVSLPGIVVLVDDVCTTGATLDACAGVLNDAGVGEVRALTAARVSAPPR